MRNKTWSTYPWWLLLVGFAFGVLVTVLATQGRVQTVTVYRDDGRMPDEIWLQATRLVQDATLSARLSAQGIPAANALDPLLMQATDMAIQATASANGAQMQPGTLEPLLMTATGIVIEATAVAGQASR